MTDLGLSGGMGRQVAAASRAGQWTVAPRGSVSVQAGPGDVVVLPGRGLRLPRQLPFEKWLRVGRQLADIYSSSAWCLGDWLAYGQAAWPGRYRAAIERTSLDYQTLRNYAWVARRFSLSRRRDSLSFGHHAEVAALPGAEQDFWQRKAEELSWPVKQLRREVRASHDERSARDARRPGQMPGESQIRGGSLTDQPAEDQRPAVRLDVHVTPGQMKDYQTAADESGLTVEESQPPHCGQLLHALELSTPPADPADYYRSASAQDCWISADVCLRVLVDPGYDAGPAIGYALEPVVATTTNDLRHPRDRSLRCRGRLASEHQLGAIAEARGRR